MLKNYIKAARLRTLPLSVSGIILGSFLGVNHLKIDASILGSLIFWLAILTTIGFQILSNFANDYGDGIKGTDKNRKGEARMVASGAISAQQMKTAMILTTIFTFVVAIMLIYVAFGKDNFLYSLLFFGLGIAAAVAAIKYTVGKSAYGYNGLGDVFVFLFFGLLSVVGTFFLYTKTIDYFVFLPAVSVGLLSVAVLNLNNLRDRIQDKINSKNTLVVILGEQKAKLYHYLLILISLITALSFVIINLKSMFQLLFLVAYIPLIKNCITVKNNNNPSALDSELKKVALSTFLFAILFGLGNIF
ncbi:UNVERIFIED_CONTAM: hypothetical protein GTU68_033742 [Idotea baltica]|nr:hypothetical protein [Idotea baltica]